MTGEGRLGRRTARLGVRTDGSSGAADFARSVESRVGVGYRWMTVGVIAVATAGGAVKMLQCRRPGWRYATMCALALVERAWLLWYLSTRDDADAPMAIGVDAVALSAAMLVGAPRFPQQGDVEPIANMVGGSSAAYPHLGGPVVGPAAMALLMTVTPIAYWRNDRRRERLLEGAATGLAHLRGYVLSYVAARGFRVVAVRLAEAAALAERQKASEAEALERERLYGVIHDHTLYGLEQIAGPEPPGLDEARKIARVEADRLRLRLGAVEPDGGFPWSALATEFARDGLDVTVTVDPEVSPATWHGEPLRVFADALREALRNVVKHAGAGHASVRVGCDGTRATAEVTDDGSGFDPGDSATGYGLAKRVIVPVQTLGGDVEIESAVGSGTTVRIVLPLGVDAG